MTVFLTRFWQSQLFPLPAVSWELNDASKLKPKSTNFQITDSLFLLLPVYMKVSQGFSSQPLARGPPEGGQLVLPGSDKTEIQLTISTVQNSNYSTTIITCNWLVVSGGITQTPHLYLCFFPVIYMRGGKVSSSPSPNGHWNDNWCPFVSSVFWMWKASLYFV